MAKIDPSRVDELRRALVKRGFKHDDPLGHECAGCGEFAVVRYVLQSRLGGRDIDLCIRCGLARSWSRRAGTEDREEEAEFDLIRFLRL
ncbi:MAG: hypothetical protein KBG28_13905 [Kofleriaceae bacterium]|jgi:hypothetical protein|nr:hypothetical protein [Kofleriaceae bacterium]MBP6837855.1 hypothetical protein [Kofleriaceae bacterium]MBP9205058.1 hypothetical protein [Kofleriaceae bacterium]